MESNLVDGRVGGDSIGGGLGFQRMWVVVVVYRKGVIGRRRSDIYYY